jgi:hypothetical protein
MIRMIKVFETEDFLSKTPQSYTEIVKFLSSSEELTPEFQNRITAQLQRLTRLANLEPYDQEDKKPTRRKDALKPTHQIWTQPKKLAPIEMMYFPRVVS